jgi:hypothetical protein
LDCPAIPVGAFFGWMALTVWADAGPGVEAGLDPEAAGFGVGEAGLPGVAGGDAADGEALRAGAAAWEIGGLEDDPLGDGCWDTGAAVQATIQTSRTPAKRPTRCGDIAARIMCLGSSRGPFSTWRDGAWLGPELPCKRYKRPGATGGLADVRGPAGIAVVRGCPRRGR